MRMMLCGCIVRPCWGTALLPAVERRADTDELACYRRPGGSFVSVNMGYVPPRWAPAWSMARPVSVESRASPSL